MLEKISSDTKRIERYKKILNFCVNKVSLMKLYDYIDSSALATIRIDCDYLSDNGYMEISKENVGMLNKAELHYLTLNTNFDESKYVSASSRISETKRAKKAEEAAFIKAMADNPHSRVFMLDSNSDKKNNPFNEKLKQSQALYSRERKSARTWVSGSSLQSVFF